MQVPKLLRTARRHGLSMEGRGENMGAIYRIYNTKTRQSYIGQSNRPYHRIQDHLTPGCPNASREIQAALLNHPPESWQWEIKADGKDYPHVSLNDLECLFIDLYDSRVRGYNTKPGGGGAASGDTLDETELRRGMRDRIVSAISAYQQEQNQGQVRINLMALADQPDSVLISLIEYMSDVQNLEDLKGMIAEEKSLNEVEKAYEQIADLVSSKLYLSKVDDILELLKPVLDEIPEDLRSYFFLQFSFQWEVEKAEDGEEVGSWSCTPRLLTPFDYRNA